MRQALELALEFIERVNKDGWILADFEPEMYNTITAIKEALAQPEQWGASAVTHPEYIAEQKAKTQELRSMLAQPEQEPVAWMLEGWGPDCGPYFEIYRDDEMGWRNKKEWTPLYTTPPQRKPLTDEQLKPLIQKAMMYYGHNPEHWTVTAGAGFCILARAIEAAHGIKE